MTDATGKVECLTIYLGWYSGRAIHIHVKVRTDSASQPSAESTSQLYFDDALTDRVHTQSPYSLNGQRNGTNAQDGVFQEGGDQLTLQTPEANGYRGAFDIGLQIS